MCTDCNEITIPNGVDGENAYTVLTASYTQPAVNTNVTISVSNTGQYSTGWCAIGQLIYIASGGYYEVVSKTSTTITIKYTASYTTYNQSLTAAAGTVPNSGVVSPGGIVGPTGATGSAGSNGTNGLRVLYSSMDDSGNTNTAGTQTLKSYTITANELGTNGDEIELDIICPIDLVPTGTGTLSIQVGSNTSGIALTDNTTIRINVKISRIDASNILRTTQYLVDTGSASSSRLIVTSELFDSTISNPIYLKSVLSNNGADQVIVNKFTVYKNKI